MVTNAQHQMIHIKGTWKIGNIVINFYDDKFKIEKNRKHIVNGIFYFEDAENNNYDLKLFLVFENFRIDCSFKNGKTIRERIINCNIEEFTILNGIWKRLDY
jgi:hypothetical protein